MLIGRYLVKDMGVTLTVVSGMLLLLFLSNQFIRYLTASAAGKFSNATVMYLLALHIPALLTLLLPLSLFLAILLVYGRLYADQEMVVLQACGFSLNQLGRLTLIFASLMTVFTLWLALELGPQVRTRIEQLRQQAKQAAIIDLIQPGRFRQAQGGRRIYYAEQIAEDREQISNLFMAQQMTEDAINPSWAVTIANKGHIEYDPKQKQRVLVIEEGSRYQGVPGQRDYREVQFKRYRLPLVSQEKQSRYSLQASSSADLWKKRDDSSAWSELNWRLAMPFSLLILASLAIPLARVQPRQGRYAKILPGLIIYIIYANLLVIGRAWLEDAKVPAWLGLWWVHATFIAVSLSLWWQQQHVRVWWPKRSVR